MPDSGDFHILRGIRQFKKHPTVLVAFLFLILEQNFCPKIFHIDMLKYFVKFIGWTSGGNLAIFDEF